MRTVFSLIGLVALAYLALCGWVYAIQRTQIYFPTPDTRHPGAQPVWLESHGARLKIWVVPRAGSQALLYFGGNAEDVGANAGSFSWAFPHHTLYLVNYRGYGGSSGEPAEPGLLEDALVIHDYVRAKHSSIAVMGRSLGGGVATYLASERPVDRLVLVTAFDSLASVARAHFRWLPVGLLLRDRYDSAKRAPQVSAPVLMVVAGEDEIVPREHSDALAAAFAPGQVRLEVVPGATHNTLDQSPAYLEAVRTFLIEGPRPPAPHTHE